MTESHAVEQFLLEFKEKMKIRNVLYLDGRSKNLKTLTDLELPPAQRTKVLEELTLENYSQGPTEDSAYQGSPMWVFGRQVKSKEVYIKIKMGLPGTSVLCISFHKAEHPINYPFKLGKNEKSTHRKGNEARNRASS